MKVVMVMRHAVLAALASTLLNGCAYVDRLKSIGQQPPLTAVDNPTTRPGYKPVQMPMPAAQPAAYNPNSLWRNGSRAFFKDQRAHQIGDILTVKVNITDKANIDNETKRSRAMTEDSGINNFFGKPKVPIMNTPVPTRIFTADSNTTQDGKGSVQRQEALQTNVAGVVTQVLPNGNLVIEGKRQHHRLDQDRAGPHRLWRARPNHRHAAKPLRRAIIRRSSTVLVPRSLPGSRAVFASRVRETAFTTRSPAAPRPETALF